MKIMKISIIFLLIIGFIVVLNSIAKPIEDRDWVIEAVIYLSGGSSHFYFIQIDENNVIRTRFGSGQSAVVTTLDEKLLREVRNEAENVLSNNEMQTILLLAKELEEVGVIDEAGIASGTWIWDVVLTYNGVRYSMNYNMAVNYINWGEAFHEGAPPISHYEIFIRLVDEIIRLSPIQIEMF